jgi:hypothetical protein
MYTPEEALEELEFAVRQLGYKVAMVGGLMRRPVPFVAEEHPEAARFAEWYDVIGIDSDHDYDPVWAKCRELKVAPSFHNGARSILLRNSPSNFCYNHIGHFASAGHAVAKALFFGGVTRRFPDLNFAFLEGGVGWGCMLYADLIGHWDKRRREAIERTNPGKLDLGRLLEFAQKYGSAAVVEAIRRGDGLDGDSNSRLTGGIEDLDDYFRCRIERKEDIATSSSPAITSAAKPTIRSMPGRSTAGPTPWEPGSTRCSARTSATSTCRTWPRSSPRPTSWSSTGCSTTTTSGTSCSPTPSASGAR